MTKKRRLNENLEEEELREDFMTPGEPDEVFYNTRAMPEEKPAVFPVACRQPDLIQLQQQEEGIS